MNTLTPEKRRMIAIIKRFQKLVASYPVESNAYQSDETFIMDMIYCIGVSIRPKFFSFNDGFKKFKPTVIKAISKI